MPEAFQLHRDMGCTRAEFIGWLPGATRQASFQIDGDKVTVITHGGRVQISLASAPRANLSRNPSPCDQREGLVITGVWSTSFSLRLAQNSKLKFVLYTPVAQ